MHTLFIFFISRKGRLFETGRQAIVAKFLNEIFRLKELRTHSDLKVKRPRRKPLFCREALSDQLKEDGPWLISMYMYFNSALLKHIGGVFWYRDAN